VAILATDRHSGPRGSAFVVKESSFWDVELLAQKKRDGAAPSEGASSACCQVVHVDSALLGSCACSLAGLVCVVLLFRLCALGMQSRVGIVGGVSAVGFSLVSTVSSPGPSGSALGGGHVWGGRLPRWQPSRFTG